MGSLPKYFALVCFLFVGSAWAETFQCTITARLHLNDPAVQLSGEFDGDRPLELRAKAFVFKVQHVLPDGQSRLAMWLGTGDENSAVTLGRFEDNVHYINLKLGELFAIGECRKI